MTVNNPQFIQSPHKIEEEEWKEEEVANHGLSGESRYSQSRTSVIIRESHSLSDSVILQLNFEFI